MPFIAGFNRYIPALLTVMLQVVACDLHASDEQLVDALNSNIEAFDSIESVDLDGLMKRIGDARLVLLGESTHGTNEFYSMRARISKALIEHKGFNIIALEADWPDVSRIDHYIRSDPRPPLYRKAPFATFQRFMWVNQPFIAFTDWLRSVNSARRGDGQAHGQDSIHVYGLDLYNMQGSMRLVLDYLQAVDPEAAGLAWQNYRCLYASVAEPGRYGHDAVSGRHPVCRQQVEMVFRLLRDNADSWKKQDEDRYFDALSNALLVVRDEYFFRRKFSSDADSDRDSWNYREQNLLQSIQQILDHHGAGTKIIVWAHNTHVGDSRATVLAEDDRRSLGQRVRESFAGQAYLVGFGTDTGTVTAAPGWNRAAQTMQVPRSHEDSFGHLLHRADAANFMLPLAAIQQEDLASALSEKRGLRAIGVMYDPDKEVEKHYMGARLAEQFDEFIWFDQSNALLPP